jgi:hypothetical protein
MAGNSSCLRWPKELTPKPATSLTPRTWDIGGETPAVNLSIHPYYMRHNAKNQRHTKQFRSEFSMNKSNHKPFQGV